MSYTFGSSRIAQFASLTSRVLALKGTTMEYSVFQEHWETITVPLINAWSHSESLAEQNSNWTPLTYDYALFYGIA